MARRRRLQTHLSPSAPNGNLVLVPLVFDFDGKEVGQRALAALRRAAQTDSIWLTCRDARFRETVTLEGIAFSRLDAAGAVFEHGLTVADCAVLGSMDLAGIEASRVSLQAVRVGRSLFVQRAVVATRRLERRLGFAPSAGAAPARLLASRSAMRRASRATIGRSSASIPARLPERAT